jgi:hypothetical protein
VYTQYAGFYFLGENHLAAENNAISVELVKFTKITKPETN